jgi:hypothetical protein
MGSGGNSEVDDGRVIPPFKIKKKPFEGNTKNIRE